MRERTEVKGKDMNNINTARNYPAADSYVGGSFEKEEKRLMLRAGHTPEKKRTEGNPVGAYVLPLEIGFGWSSRLEQIVEMVRRADIFRFDGMVPYIEVRPDPHLDDPVAAVQTAINACRRFNSFRGVVGVRMDGWENDLGSYVVDKLIRFAAGHRDNIIFVFGISGSDEEKVDQLYSLLLPHFSLRRLETERFTAHTLAANISRQLDECGLTVDRCGREELLRMCGSAVEGSSFQGYRTAGIIADDLIGAASERGVRRRIPASLLAEYARSDAFGLRCSAEDPQCTTGFKA